MATKNSAVFLLGLLLSCVAMSSAARILEETVPSKEEHQPEVPPLPKAPFPEVRLPPKPELPKVELPPLPEVHLPSKPELPTVPGFHLPEPEAKP